MSSYRKTMSEAYKSMYLTKNDTLKPIKEEVELDEGTSQVLAHGGKGQYKVTSGGGVTTVKFKGKVVSSGDFDQGADGWFMNIKGEKGQKFFDTAQEMADYFAKNKITEEADLDEGTWYTAKNMTRLQKMIQKPMPKNHTSVKFVMKHIGDDELMDNMDDAKNGTDLSPMVKSAMKRIGIKEEAVSMAQQAAIAISKKERGNKPKKEEVELDELKPPSRHVGKSQKNPDMFAVYDQKEKEVKLFKDKKDAEEYAIKNHEELMGHDKPKNVKEEVECDCDCGKSPCEKCGQDHHGIVEEVELGEGFSPKEIKMAIGVASDKRYAGGNMTGAAAAIDKIKKGLSDHPQVAAVLRRQNEEVGIDEASKEGTIKIIKTKDGKFQIQKMTKGKFVDMGKPYNSAKEAEKFRSGQPDLFGEASARADAMRAMRKGKSIDPADVDNVASDDDVKAASKNIMMQLRKSVNRASRGVEFGDKKKVQVDPKIAQAVISKYNSLRRPSDKEIFQAKIAKSYKDMLKALKESTIKESKFGIINKQLKGEK